jgi:hypothetical protein
MKTGPDTTAAPGRPTDVNDVKPVHMAALEAANQRRLLGLGKRPRAVVAPPRRDDAARSPIAALEQASAKYLLKIQRADVRNPYADTVPVPRTRASSRPRERRDGACRRSSSSSSSGDDGPSDEHPGAARRRRVAWPAITGGER